MNNKPILGNNSVYLSAEVIKELLKGHKPGDSIAIGEGAYAAKGSIAIGDGAKAGEEDE